MGFLCVLKMYHIRLYIVEKMGFRMTPIQCGIHSKSQPLLQKTCFYYYFLLLYIFETLAAYAGVCLRVHTLAHVRELKATLVIYFQK